MKIKEVNFMEFKTLPYAIKQFYTMYNGKNRSLNLEHPLQRGDVWNKERKSEFIHSLFIGLRILPILAIHESFPEPLIINNKEIKKSSVIDGKQRLLSIFQYLDNKFRTPENTIYLNINNEEVDVSNKYFSELLEDSQTTFLNITLNITLISEYTTYELERLIIGYNSGKSMNTKQLFKLEIGLNKTLEFKNFIENNLFFKAIENKFSNMQKNNNEDIISVIRAMILLSEINCKSFEFEDVISFIKEYPYNPLMSEIKAASEILYNILISQDNKDFILLKKTDWTFYLKRIPYLLYTAAKMNPSSIKNLILNDSLKFIMPDSLLIRKSYEYNKEFIEKVNNQIEENTI